MPGHAQPASGENAKPRFFKSTAEFRKYLAREHARQEALWVGYHRVGSGTPSMTWAESVDVALCFGWIDSVRRGIDETRYMIRFTPRRRGSIWSTKNINRMHELIEAGLVAPAGLEAFEARTAERSGRYSFEQSEPARLSPEFERRLRANPAARADFEARPPWYRRAAIHWVMSAKREETRERRFQQLLECSERGEVIGPLRRPQD